MLYEVVYRIEVEAKSPLAAALEVEQILKEAAFRPCLEVILAYKAKEKGKKPNIIDLEKRIVK